MKTSVIVLALMGIGSAHKLSKIEIHRDQLLDIGVRFEDSLV